MEQLPARCSFGYQSFVLFIGRDMELASIHSRVSERLGINLQENMLKYLLPIDAHVEQVLLDDEDVQTMFDLHKCQGTSFINLQIHAVDTRCLSTHASRQLGDPPPLDRSTSNTHGGSLKTTEPSHLPGSSLELFDRGKGEEGEVPILTQYCLGRIHYVGQVFISKEQLQMELTNYAITRGFNWKYLKNDTVRLTVRCYVDVCPCRLHAFVIREGPEFAIKTLNNIHSCGCDIMSDGHPRTSKKWVVNVVKGKLVDKPTYRASEMMRDIRWDYGISIPYHQAWWGKEVDVSSLYGDFRISYHMLNWYNERALQSNPGSVLSLEVDPETQRFKCFFICFQASAYGFEVGCRPMLFLDGTHIKQHRVQGVILAASALNGNNELFTVAYSIADSETYDNWVWFLQNLKKALLSDRRITFLSDRGKGLNEVIPDIFPNDHHAYCFQHIMQNFNDQCVGKYAAPFKKLLRKILQRIAYAVTEQEYQDAMMAVEINSADAKEWVLRNDVDHWSHARFPGQRFASSNTQATCSITFRHL
ncbi:hypothetical protein Taro_006589 [Colocasia esculenta]|uniref:MULE transposase domain-containing protein n=1 Tax=Colocasia esculenta TaxID=4460 RepID=A0A843TVS3_COLES|nr:hypothetical protein [Colocasia esculenta]